MKIKLIQAGGFMGRSKVAEEELTAYPTEVQQQLEETFSKAQQTPAAVPPSASRDAFHYLIVYKGKTIPLEAIKMTPELSGIIGQLKAKLKY